MTYIIPTDKGFKLLKELPIRPTRTYRFTKTGSEKFNKYEQQVQQAIDSAPFIKNTEVVSKLLAIVGGRPRRTKLRKNHPYPIDLSGYDVSEIHWDGIVKNTSIDWVRLPPNDLDFYKKDKWDIRKFVTLTPKAAENKHAGFPNGYTSHGSKSEATENSALVSVPITQKEFQRILDDRYKAAPENSAQVESQEETPEDEEARTERNTTVVASFIEHCKARGIKIPDSAFESFFNA